MIKQRNNSLEKQKRSSHEKIIVHGFITLDGVIHAPGGAVVSTALKSAADWRNSTLISRDVVEEVRKLKGRL